MASRMNEPTRGILQMIFAASSFAVMAIFVRFCSPAISSFEIVFLRSLFGGAAIAFIIWREKAAWIGKNVIILFLRGLFGFIALSLHFYAISKLGLGTAVILNYASPIYVVILARIFLKERTGAIINWLILISFIGVYLLTGSQFQTKPFAIFVGIMSGILAAVAYILIRFNDDGESPYTIVFYFMVIATIGSLPLLKFGFKWPSLLEWAGLFAVVAGGFFGQIWLTKAIQSAPVSLVLPFSYLTPIVAAGAGILFWDEKLGAQSFVGALMIIASGVLIYVFRKKTAFIPIEE
jgi:drug/metabolite transporter (DMT)-like permease